MYRDTSGRLAQAVAAVHNRWGPQALSTSGQVAESNGYLSTGFSELDALLGGGIPCGRITTIVGQATSGRRTLALRTLAKAQGNGQLTAYLDIDHTFDPEYAAHCGVDLAHVLVVRPDHSREALMILQALVVTGEVKVIVVDNIDAFGRELRGAQRFVDTLCRLLSPLAATHCTLICLGGSADGVLDNRHADAVAHLATVRLHLAQEQWIQKHHDVCGYQAQLSVLKHKRVAALTSTLLTISIPAL
jgi:hypothetical protein